MIPLALGKREKILILGAVTLLTLFVVTQLIVGPLLAKRARLQAGIASQRKNLAEILALRSEFQQIRRQADEARNLLKHREKGFTLFSFLEGLAAKAGLKENISYMKPSVKENEGQGFKTARVEMKLKSVTLKQLVQFLERVETSGKSIFIKRLSITRKRTRKKRIDVLLLVETYIL